MRGSAILVIGAVVAVAAARNVSIYSTAACVYPEICQPPATKYSKVLPIRPRMQWNTNGGFCGSLSFQVMAMTYGAWLSQDHIRKANIGGPCFGHTDLTAPDGISGPSGCEVGPENYGFTAGRLRLAFDEWDWSQPAPQADAFKRWIKSHLARGEPVMWAPMEKRGPHILYGPRGCPGNGRFDHHEPIIGFGSNHDLADSNLYDDDWVVHFSDYDLQPCYRKMSTMEDSDSMDGNCKNVTSKGQMYPCFYREVTYGMSVLGLDVRVPTLRVILDVDQPSEPNPRRGEAIIHLRGTVRVYGLQPGGRYVLYRFNSTKTLPYRNFERGYEHKVNFVAPGEIWKYEDPTPFPSDGVTYYVAVPEGQVKMMVTRAPPSDMESPPSGLWMHRAPVWPATVVDTVRGFMASPKFEGGGASEALAQVSDGLPPAGPVACGVLLVSAGLTSLVQRLRWSRRDHGVMLEYPALG